MSLKIIGRIGQELMLTVCGTKGVKRAFVQRGDLVGLYAHAANRVDVQVFHIVAPMADFQCSAGSSAQSRSLAVRAYPDASRSSHTATGRRLRQRRILLGDCLDQLADFVSGWNCIGHSRPQIGGSAHRLQRPTQTIEFALRFVDALTDDVAHERAWTLRATTASDDLANFGQRETEGLANSDETQSVQFHRPKELVTT